MTESATAPSSSADGVRWNLDDLYAGAGDPRAREEREDAMAEADHFAAACRGRMSGWSPAQLAENTAWLESIEAKGYRPLIHAQLLFAGNARIPRHGALLQEMREWHTEFRKRLLFFELEWRALDEATAQSLLQDASLARHRHWLERSRAEAPYTLSEPEERILAVKDNSGRLAFQRLFDEKIAAMECPLPGGGETAGGRESEEPVAPRPLSLEEALALLYHPSREQRKAAAEGITSALRANQHTLAYILNTMLADHAGNDRLRGRDHPMLARNLSNEIGQGAVDALLEACDGGMRLVSRFYELKRRLLGLDRLYDYDRYAPLAESLPSCSFAEARTIVLEAYGGFSPTLSEIAGRFFSSHWIDAELRKGKAGGGFSAGTLPELHPYILINYSDNLRDAMVLAHELGHGIHQYLSRERGFFQMNTPLTMAETASVFGEMLTFRKLMADRPDPRVRLGLLCGKLEGIFATVFRQAAMTRFEQSLHRARREQGELEAGSIGDLWMSANRTMFGDSLELREEYACWWSYISHFIHAPFYCYAYSFGELLVLALYRRFEEEGASFVPRYLELLSAGGSRSPSALLEPFGLRIGDPAFWNKGIGLLEEMVAQAEALAVSLNARTGADSSPPPIS